MALIIPASVTFISAAAGLVYYFTREEKPRQNPVLVDIQTFDRSMLKRVEKREVRYMDDRLTEMLNIAIQERREAIEGR